MVRHYYEGGSRFVFIVYSWRLFDAITAQRRAITNAFALCQWLVKLFFTLSKIEYFFVLHTYTINIFLLSLL
jgi:hypothetical protein